MFTVVAQNPQFFSRQTYQDYLEASAAAHDLVAYTQQVGGKSHVAVHGKDGRIWSYDIDPKPGK